MWEGGVEEFLGIGNVGGKDCVVNCLPTLDDRSKQ